jgi:hypothetical protein
MGQHIQQQRDSADDPTLRIAASVLDGARALLGLHSPRARQDGTFYCAHCLDEAGGHTWPCQTIYAFGTALLRRWQPPPVETTAQRPVCRPSTPPRSATGSVPARSVVEDRGL